MTDVRRLLPDDALDTVLGSYETALSQAYLFCVLVSFFGFISCLFIQQNRLDNKVRK